MRHVRFEQVMSQSHGLVMPHTNDIYTRSTTTCRLQNLYTTYMSHVCSLGTYRLQNLYTTYMSQVWHRFSPCRQPVDIHVVTCMTQSCRRVSHVWHSHIHSTCHMYDTVIYTLHVTCMTQSYTLYMSHVWHSHIHSLHENLQRSCSHMYDTVMSHAECHMYDTGCNTLQPVEYHMYDTVMSHARGWVMPRTNKSRRTHINE